MLESDTRLFVMPLKQGFIETGNSVSSKIINKENMLKIETEGELQVSDRREQREKN